MGKRPRNSLDYNNNNNNNSKRGTKYKQLNKSNIIGGGRRKTIKDLAKAIKWFFNSPIPGYYDEKEGLRLGDDERPLALAMKQAVMNNYSTTTTTTTTGGGGGALNVNTKKGKRSRSPIPTRSSSSTATSNKKKSSSSSRSRRPLSSKVYNNNNSNISTSIDKPKRLADIDFSNLSARGFGIKKDPNADRIWYKLQKEWEANIHPDLNCLYSLKEYQCAGIYSQHYKAQEEAAQKKLEFIMENNNNTYDDDDDDDDPSLTPLPLAEKQQQPLMNNNNHMVGGKGENKLFSFELPLYYGYDVLLSQERDFYLPEDILVYAELQDMIKRKENSRRPKPYIKLSQNVFVDRKPRKGFEETPVCQCKPLKDHLDDIGNNNSNNDDGDDDGKSEASSANNTSIRRLGCDTNDCLNRCTFIECNPDRCNLQEMCANQRFQRRQQVDELEVYWTSVRGFGLRTNVNIMPGTLVKEYRGEVISSETCLERMNTIYKDLGNYYFLEYDTNEVLDACRKGTEARFVNHSCDPNCHIEKWQVNGEFCIGLFASRLIPAGTELTYDYRFQAYGPMQRCACGSAKCRGAIGINKKSEHVLEMELEEKRIEKLHAQQLRIMAEETTEAEVAFSLRQYSKQDFLASFKRILRMRSFMRDSRLLLVRNYASLVWELLRDDLSKVSELYRQIGNGRVEPPTIATTTTRRRRNKNRSSNLVVVEVEQQQQQQLQQGKRLNDVLKRQFNYYCNDDDDDLNGIVDGWLEDSLKRSNNLEEDFSSNNVGVVGEKEEDFSSNVVQVGGGDEEEELLKGGFGKSDDVVMEEEEQGVYDVTMSDINDFR